MRFYQKLIGGYALFIVLGLFAGIAVSAFFLLATLPMVSLFPQPSMAPQVALVISAFIGIITAVMVAALCIGSWQKRLEVDYYHEHADDFHAAPGWDLDRHVRVTPHRAATPDSYAPPMIRRGTKGR